MRQKKLFTALRYLGVTLLVLIGLVAALLFAGVLVLRSNWGQNKLLALALPAANSALTGRIEVKSLGGDLLRRLILYDIKLYDSEKQLLASVSRIELRYNLWALLHRDVHVTFAEVKDGHVRLRYLADGRLNVAALTKPKPQSGPLPVSVTLSGIAVDLTAQFEPQEGTQVPPVGAELHLEAAARIVDPRITAEIKALKVHTSEPLAADLELSGGVHLVTVETPQLEARGLALTVRTSGEEVNRLVPAAELLGDWQLDLLLRGPLTALAVEAKLRPPKGQLRLAGTVGVLDIKRPWQIELEAQGLDPASSRRGVPQAAVDLKITGRGEGPIGRIELVKLGLATAGGRLGGHGFAEGNATEKLGFPLPSGIAAALVLNVDAKDLAALVRPFAPRSLKVGGSLTAEIKAAADRGQLRLDVGLDGRRLQAAGNYIEKLSLELSSVDLAGKLKLRAKTLESPLRLATFDLEAELNRQAVSLHALGRDRGNLVFEFLTAGQPTLRGQELLRIDATLKQLFLTRGAERLALVRPARLALDLQEKAGPIFDVERLALRLADQELTLAAHFEAKSQRFRASLDATRINARRWAQVAGASGVPETRLDLHARAAGTPRTPEGRVELSGTVAPLADLHLPASELRAAVTLHGRRAEGRLDLQLGAPSLGGERASASLRFDAPLAAAGPLTVSLDAKTRLEQWQALLPPSASGLCGLMTLRTSVRGTLARPELDLALALPAWQLTELRGRDTSLAVTYGGERLGVQLSGQLANAANAQLAAAKLSAQTQLRLGIGPGLSGAAIKRQLLGGALAVDASVSAGDLPKLLTALLAEPEPPLTAGALDTTLHIEGTPLAPNLRLDINGKGLAAAGIKDLSLSTAVRYAGTALTADVKAGMGQQQILSGRAETQVAVAELLAGRFSWKTLPAHALVQILPVELSQVSRVHGSISGHAEVSGTAGTPELAAWVRSDSVKLDNFAVGPLVLNVTLDKARLLKADLDARQSSGSLKLVARTQVPPRPDSIYVDLTAKDFRVDYSARPGQTSLTDALGMARGVLNADLKVKVADFGPSVAGSLKLENGGLLMKALQQELKDIYVDLSVQPQGPGGRRSVITLSEARLTADTGKAKLSGRVELDGIKLDSLTLDGEARQFPVWAGVMGLWIDSKLAVRGKTEGDTLKLGVDIPEGGVRVPKFESARSVQPLGPLEDVEYVDRAAQKAAARVAEAEAKDKDKAAGPRKVPGPLPSHVRASVQLPDAFHIAGPEVRADVTGRIDLSMDGPGLPSITGQVHTIPAWGWVEILRHRYDISRVELSLSGETPPNPLFDIEISRKLDEATLFIMVGGNAKKPRITFRSEPPIYDQSQIIAIILTGESGAAKKDTQALGVLSSLLIGQLRDQLAGRLPIDVLRVDVAGSDPMGVSQSSLEIGKYLRDDLYLGYKRRFGSATTGMRRLNADEVLLEYHFLRSYKLRTLYGDANVGALDLYWTKRF